VTAFEKYVVRKEVREIAKLRKFYILVWSRNSVVGIATLYGLDGPGIESRWGRDIPYLSRPALRLT
jgi:hypothetical protein